MRILDNAGAGIGASVPIMNLPQGLHWLVVWGATVTDVDFDFSPDGGTTWIPIQATIAANGVFAVRLGGGENKDYQVRGNVVTGAGVYMDLIEEAH